MDIFQQVQTILDNTTDTNTAVHEIMAMLVIQDFMLLLILLILAFIVFYRKT